MSVLAAALTSMAEQISLMAQVQAAAIVENRDKADLQARLQKQSIEVISRLAPVVAGSQDLTAGELSEVTSQLRDLVPTSPVAVPASVNDAQATAIGEAPKVAEPVASNAEITAQASAEPAVESAPAPKTATPRVLPSLVSSTPQAPAANETGRASKPAGAKLRASAKPKSFSPVVPKAAVETPKPTAAVASQGVDGEASATGKRLRRTKAQMEEFRREQQKLEELGLKRGRGRPGKQALSAEQLAAIAASENPEAALAEAHALMKREAQKEARAKAKAKAAAKAEAKSKAKAEADAKSAANATEAAASEVAADSVDVAPAPVAAKGGRRSKTVVAGDEAVAVVVEAPVRRGRQPKVRAEDAPTTVVAPVKKTSAKKAAKVVEAAPQPEAAPAPKPRGRPRKETVAAVATTAPEPVREAAAKPAAKPRGGSRQDTVTAVATTAPEPVQEAAPAPKPRGRPRKDTVTAGATTAPKAAQEAVASPAPKARGGSRKNAVSAVATPAPEPAQEAAAAPAPKPRGRPRKDTVTAGATIAPKAAQEAVASPAPKARGGSRKNAVSAVATPAPEPVQEAAAAPAPKRRGRPPKAAAVAEVAKAAEVAATPAAVTAPAGKPRGRPRKDAVATSDALPAKSDRASRTSKASGAAAGISSINWAKVKVSSDVMVLNSGKTTTMQIGRKIWEAAGFADDESVFVLSNGQEIKITKQSGGRKPSSAKGNVITLTVPSIGQESLWKIKYAVEGDALLLHGQLAG